MVNQLCLLCVLQIDLRFCKFGMGALGCKCIRVYLAEVYISKVRFGATGTADM